MPRKFLVPLLVVFLISLVYFLLLIFSRPNKNLITASGTVEAETCEISSKVTGRIAEIMEEGEPVVAQKVLATLQAPEIELDLERAKAALLAQQAQVKALNSRLTIAQTQLSQAELNYQSADKNYTASKDRAEASLDKAGSQLKLLETGYRKEEKERASEQMNSALATSREAEKNYQRSKELYRIGAISRHDLDRAETAFLVASAQYQSAQAYFAQLESGYRKEEIATGKAQFQEGEAALKGVLAQAPQVEIQQKEVLKAEKALKISQQELKAAQAKEKEIQALLGIARQNLAETQLLSPLNGWVSKKYRKKGELVFPGTALLELVDLSDIWVEIYLPEKELGRIKLGDKARVFIDSFPQKPFAGKISFISRNAEFTPKNIQTKDERINLVFKVKVKVENPEGLLKPGVPADVEIWL